MVIWLSQMAETERAATRVAAAKESFMVDGFRFGNGLRNAIVFCVLCDIMNARGLDVFSSS